MSALSDATRLLATTLQQVAGESVSYVRGATTLTGLIATPDAQTYEVQDANGFMVTVQSFDWLFTATDLVIDDTRFEPRSGDQIVATLNGVLQTFEVMPVGTRPPAEAADADGIMVVAHSKRVS